jgi:hypothetical protein
MIQGLVLIEGKNVKQTTLKSLPLSNALQVIVGNAPGFGVILHIAANSIADFSNALPRFAQVAGVTGVVTLALRTT